MERKTAQHVAVKLVEELFPTCEVAFLAGSVVRGEATKTSDLDIVIFIKELKQSYRESIYYSEWPVELFVHNFNSYISFMDADCKRARPSLPRMIAEGIIIKGDKQAKIFKEEAINRLNKGPEQWTEETIALKRYFLTDMLDDLMGSTNREESLFIVNALAEALHEFYLRMNGQWIGASKWIVRALKNYEEGYANQFVKAFEAFYQTNNKKQIIDLVHDTLEPYGGRLFTGFTLGK